MAAAKTTPFFPFAPRFRCSSRFTIFLDFRGKLIGLLLGLLFLAANATNYYNACLSVQFFDSEPNVRVNPVIEFQVVNYNFIYFGSQNCCSLSSDFITSQA